MAFCPGCMKQFSANQGLARHLRQTQQPRCHAIYRAMQEEMLPGLREELERPPSAGASGSQKSDAGRAAHFHDYFGEYNAEDVEREASMEIEQDNEDLDVMMVDDDGSADEEQEGKEDEEAEEAEEDDRCLLNSDSDYELDDAFKYVHT